MSYPVETDEHGNAIPPEQTPKCPKCGKAFEVVSIMTDCYIVGCPEHREYDQIRKQQPEIPPAPNPNEWTQEQIDEAKLVNAEPVTPKQELGGLQPEIMKKPKIVKCSKCGSTTFHLIKNVDIVDTLSFDDQTDEPFIELYNISEAMQHYIPHKQCDKIECAECGEPIPKEAFKDLPDEIKMDY